VLLALFALAIGMSLVFEHRAFCSYICPIGGFSGMYSKAAPLEVKVIDKEICARHGDKSCYQACPWGVYPLAMKDSSACGLCMECLRVCPKDNLALNLRPYGTDLTKPIHSSKLDEAFLALVMLGSALAFSAVFLGPWGWLKTSAFEIGTQGWFLYVGAFLALNLLLLPGIFTLCVAVWKKISQSTLPLRQLIAFQAQGLLPLGLLSWMAFTISFALPKLSYVLAVINDPFGWGWRWIGMGTRMGAGIGASLDVSHISLLLEIILLLVGVFWSAQVTRKLSSSGGKTSSFASFPLLAFYAAYAGAFLWLLAG
jgi:NAD-dependent dihydropyrimidine dehydrogenase PreA subunit